MDAWENDVSPKCVDSALIDMFLGHLVLVGCNITKIYEVYIELVKNVIITIENIIGWLVDVI